MPRSDNGRLASLKKRLEAFFERQIHERDEFGNSLAGVSEPVLRKAIDALCTEIPSLERIQVERAAEVAKNGNYYYRLSKGLITNLSPVVELTQDEKDNLVSERERLFSQRGMLSIICTVSLAAFLQGHVQSSINAMSLFVETIGIDIENQDETQGNGSDNIAQWQLGAMNAIPFLTAAFPGAPLSLPVNYCLGRRGALGLSALLIIASSIGSAFAKTFSHVIIARIFGGIAMGIKAVSAPVLASETAVGYWRGSTILAWQLWVACGIMIGFVANFIIAAATNTLDGKPNEQPNLHGGRYHALQWIAAAPAIPSILLLIAVCYCYESPRFYMRPDTPNYNLGCAFDILLQVRKTRLQATRDLFLIWWSTQSEEGQAIRAEPHKSHNEQTIHPEHVDAVNADCSSNSRTASSGLTYSSLILVVMRLSTDQFKPLFTRRRLRNALWSSCTVALAQQLCGINVFAFYSSRTQTLAFGHY
jgi:MFS family permease